MFKIKKRNGLIFSLILVLCVISYFNYSINKYALLETSSELERYEENQLAEISLEVVDEEADSQDTEKNVSVVDSKVNQVSDLVQESSANIEDTISNGIYTEENNYFIESRLNTSIEREKMIALLNEIISNEKTDEENRKAANNEKMKLIDVMNKESIVGNLIKAKGFEEAVVFITDNSVNVIVKSKELKDTDMAKILDIVFRETKMPLDNVKILNKF